MLYFLWTKDDNMWTQCLTFYRWYLKFILLNEILFNSNVFQVFSSHLNNKSELVQVMACIYKAYVDIYETNILWVLTRGLSTNRD